jgi:phage terminase large subunit
MTTKADKNDKLSKLDQIKKKKMYVTETSVNLIKEMRNYKFKVDRDGVVQDDVVKINDDAIDAAQYASTFLLKLSENKPRTY